MERYARGAADCFEPLFKRHAGKVYGFLFRHTGDRALSEDLFQQTWLKVHRARDSYRPGEPFAPWLYTIANNCRRDAARGRSRAKEDLTSDGSLPDAPAPAAGGDEGDRVRAALAALPEGTREIIIMHRWLDLSFAEIAQVLGDGTSEGAIKVRAHRGYLQLRDLLQIPSVTAAKQGASR
jgi:RNA polymerase sigma-70 factor (ECF subfamily)